MMGFLRRTFSRRSLSRFQQRERDERDGKGGGGGAGGVSGNPLLLAHQQQVVHAPAVVTGGSSVHIPAAGTARTTITCRVLLLDGSDVNVELAVSGSSGKAHQLCIPPTSFVVSLWIFLGVQAKRKKKNARQLSCPENERAWSQSRLQVQRQPLKRPEHSSS